MNSSLILEFLFFLNFVKKIVQFGCWLEPYQLLKILFTKLEFLAKDLLGMVELEK